ncbi:FAD-dependent oxidoreductase [Limnohabitans sp. MMS-10A-160]|uniref:NAD(P)/FAD-dependent oxidoreductase n=1 Tax=unclassified Limnohabitans TaxID=2626134 RepID=UPI000D35D5A7|nr:MULTISPECIES: NAD(P)/FAD-dependent oxidoreductase [unclassified Limnohabitans]PUE16054.1 FAD-dependent oxidoreductase [Limnohabitans sp. MMS-10A-192]PUE23908.1 FAD-dependent oxidoreductase [Limnohabitans sp. MMS-10A-160]
MEQVDAVVIGAGVVGLAVGRALALAGREVMVLESENAIGTGTSSRNSEVIHAGIYYPAGSLKARLCVQGKEMLYAYCAERGVAHQRLGKLIVATSPEQVQDLDGIVAKAAANGVHDLQKLTKAQAQALEPALSCEAALLSPSTGVIDSHGLMLSLQGDMENAGGLLALVSPVERIGVALGTGTHPIRVTTQDGTELACRVLVNAAGLHAVDLARRTEGLDHTRLPKAWYAKGNYFTLAGKAPFSRLIYPVPEKAGLGVHLTLDLGGQAKFGPDVQWVDEPTDLQVDPRRGDAFYAEVRKYWPDLADGALQAGYAGMRPKISGPHEVSADFMIQGPADHGVPGLVNLLGIESPGLTSSLAIAEQVRTLL